MSITSTVDSARHTVTFRVSNETNTADKLLREYEAALADDAITPNMHAIWDISDLRLSSVSTSEIRRLPRAMNRVMARRRYGFRVAIVTSRAVDLQLLRFYLVVLRLIGHVNIRVFPNLQQAEAWIAQAMEAEYA